MRLLILTDVHANLRALDAVLNDPRARACDGIISVGDHVNYGPLPLEVHKRLCAVGAVMLRGNHEDRVIGLRSGEDFSSVNWAILRKTAECMEGIDLTLPLTHRVGHTLIAHAAPDDTFRHLGDLRKFRAMLDTLPDDIRLYIHGHEHHSVRICHHGHVGFNPGSCGVFEGDLGGTACFAVLDTDTDTVRRHIARYDTDAVARDFLASGFTEAAPVMSRVAYTVIRTVDRGLISNFTKHCMRIGRAFDIDPFGAEAWAHAERTYPWREHCGTEEFWKRMRMTLK